MALGTGGRLSETVLCDGGKGHGRGDGGYNVGGEVIADAWDGSAVTDAGRLVVGGQTDGGGEVVGCTEDLLCDALGWICEHVGNVLLGKPLDGGRLNDSIGGDVFIGNVDEGKACHAVLGYYLLLGGGKSLQWIVRLVFVFYGREVDIVTAVLAAVKGEGGDGVLARCHEGQLGEFAKTAHSDRDWPTFGSTKWTKLCTKEEDFGLASGAS